jgi:hypothetical protein
MEQMGEPLLACQYRDWAAEIEQEIAASASEQSTLASIES